MPGDGDEVAGLMKSMLIMLFGGAIFGDEASRFTDRKRDFSLCFASIDKTIS